MTCGADLESRNLNGGEHHEQLKRNAYPYVPYILGRHQLILCLTLQHSSSSKRYPLNMSQTQTQTQPDISYHPDFQKYQLRSDKIKALNPSIKKLPGSFLSQMKGELVWEAKDYTDEKQWTLVLTEDHLAEIDDALKAFKGK